MKSEKGITLIALIITIAVMLILAVVSIDAGTDALDSTQLEGFYMQLSIIQKRVDDIEITNETYINNSGKTIDIKIDEKFKLTSSEKNTLQSILTKEGDLGLPIDDYRYFTIEELKSDLDLMEMTYNVFVHFPTRTVIAEEGITVGGESHYIMKDEVYFAEYNSNKNKGKINLSFYVSEYGSQKYKVTVEPDTVGDLKVEGTLKYKKTRSKYWETSNNLEIIVDELTKYNIEYKDKNNNSVSNIIEIKKDSKGNLIVTKIS